VGNIQQMTKQSNEQAAARDVYVPPKLKEFGPVGALTQSGTAGASEMSGKPAPVMQ
jgi:hypothetical protein